MTAPKNVLVFGGTRYFGKRLVDLLLRQGHRVTLGTRGLTPDSFGAQVERATLNRSDRTSLMALATLRPWDVVVDQICYSPNEAALSCEIFKGRVGRYVHTSTASVYQIDGIRSESDFDPFTYPLKYGERSEFDYGEGKRLAEAVYFQRASFPVSAMRIPIVLGPDDYSRRLEFHVDRIRNESPIAIPNLAAKTSFIHSAEAARFLLWLTEGGVTGPFNACSDGSISIQEILSLIERRLGKKATVTSTGAESDFTPFTDVNSTCLDTRRAREAGFKFEAVRSWLPGLVDELCARGEGRL